MLLMARDVDQLHPATPPHWQEDVGGSGETPTSSATGTAWCGDRASGTAVDAASLLGFGLQIVRGLRRGRCPGASRPCPSIRVAATTGAAPPWARS